MVSGCMFLSGETFQAQQCNLFYIYGYHFYQDRFFFFLVFWVLVDVLGVRETTLLMYKM